MISSRDYREMRVADDFKFFSIEEFDTLASHMKEHRVRKNQILFFEGDFWNSLYFSKTGYFKLEQSDASEDFSFTDFVRGRRLFPYEGIFHYDSHPFTATALTDASYYRFPRDLYVEMGEKNSLLLKQFSGKLSQLLNRRNHRLERLITPSAADRVIQILAFLLVDIGTEEGMLPFVLTQSDVAAMSGTTRETVSRVLKQLEKEKRIETINRRLKFLDEAFFLNSSKK